MRTFGLISTGSFSFAGTWFWFSSVVFEFMLLDNSDRSSASLRLTISVAVKRENTSCFSLKMTLDAI